MTREVAMPHTHRHKRGASNRRSAPRQANPTDPEVEARRLIDEHIDDALEDSFPASDPPPWTLGGPRWSARGGRARAAAADVRPRRRPHPVLLRSVRDIMQTDVYWLPDDMPLDRAAQELALRGVTAAPVGAPDGKIVGILSSTDLTRYYGGANEHRRVEDIMTKDVVIARPDDTLERAIHLMVLEHVHRVLVVDLAERLVGILSSMDILRELVGLSRRRFLGGAELDA